MRWAPATVLLIAAVLGSQVAAFADTQREDAIWARRSLTPITLDGVLNELAWSKAESVIVRYGVDAGLPGSGFKIEGGLATPTDPTFATLKFLAFGNQIYFAAVVRDSSVGGSATFNRMDGFLMAVKDHAQGGFPKGPAEYLYSWWYPTQADPHPPGQAPSFKGRWAEEPPGSPRTPEQIAAWDAVTVVDGLSNSDAANDRGYTVEMRFNCTPMGYDITDVSGDTFEWNISIYDCDWIWLNPAVQARVQYNRVWWQSPWGNAMWYNEVRIHARPDITVNSPVLPHINEELIIWEVDGTPPTINGQLNEPIWNDPLVYTFDIRWDDDALRQTYPGVGPYRSGQYQAMVNGRLAPVLDPADATVKMFFNGTKVFMGFDVRDAVVQYIADIDRWDGFIVTPTEYSLRGPDRQLLSRRLACQVAQNGSALPQDYLATMVTAGTAQVAITLKPGTTVDTLGTQADVGYFAELSFDLTALGYPANLGTGNFWMGANLLDGDSFTPFTRSYGTRTWWFKEYEGQCCPGWAYLARSVIGVDPEPVETLPGFALVKSYPNPSPGPRIQYRLPESSRVTLEVFDLQGRVIERRVVGVQSAGLREIPFDGHGRGAGVYPYRLLLEDPRSGARRATLAGKVVLLK
jgi:hypothetical protein